MRAINFLLTVLFSIVLSSCGGGGEGGNGTVAATINAKATINATPISFNPFVLQSDISLLSGSSSPIGFTFAGNKFVGSVYPNNAQLYQTDLNGGNVTAFGLPIPGGLDELYVASSFGLGGFPKNDIYVSAGSSMNGLYHFSNDGTTQGPFTVTGAIALNSDYVKGIAFDLIGNYGFDMLVSTNSGNLYKVNSSGVASLLASIPGEVLEGIDFAPAGFGPVGGQVIVASESANTLFAISAAGAVTNLSTAFGVTITSAEEIGFVPLTLGSGGPLEGFYAAAYPSSGILKADASQFVSMLGDAIVTGEFDSAVTNVHWDGAKYVVSQLGTFPAQPEDGIFVSQAMIQQSSPLSIHVTAAEVEHEEKEVSEESISMKSDFSYTGKLASKDIILVKFGGITLLEIPFDHFKQESAGKYEYETLESEAVIDFNLKTIRVLRHELLTGDLSNSNNIEVVISFGSATATDYFVNTGEKEKCGVVQQL
jgi:hypothetical protein